MPDLTYGGDCSWQPSGNPEPHDPPNELPTTREPWIGRQDLTGAFRAEYHIGREYLGGYIIDNTPRDNTPFPGVATVDLVIARPPDFAAFTTANSVATKSGTKSANVVSSAIIDDATSVDATRTVSYEAPETTYSYFSATLPDAPRYSTVAISTEPRVRRSSITARGNNGREKSWTGGLAPAPLVSALSMPAAAVVSHTSEAIPGTPWYRCRDVVTQELTGDT